MSQIQTLAAAFRAIEESDRLQSRLELLFGPQARRVQVPVRATTGRHAG